MSDTSSSGRSTQKSVAEKQKMSVMTLLYMYYHFNIVHVMEVIPDASISEQWAVPGPKLPICIYMYKVMYSDQIQRILPSGQSLELSDAAGVAVVGAVVTGVAGAGGEVAVTGAGVVGEVAVTTSVLHKSRL